jgi:hypothetical protein
MVQFTLVIARYNETIDWSSRYKRILYNKGVPLPGSVVLPNIGREAHTYLFHIVENYDRLDDYTVFLQGNPFDHSPNLFRQLDTFATLSEMPDFFHVSEVILPTNSEVDPHHRDTPVDKYYTFLFEKSPRRQFVFGAGAQFLVSRKAIQSLPLSLYKELLDMIALDTCHPGGAHAMERLWGVLFTAKHDSSPLLLPHWDRDNHR